MRRNEEYVDCCRASGKGALAALYFDFGDVLSSNFKEWWTKGERGARLFGEQHLSVNLSELQNAAAWDVNWTPNSVIVVVVPLNLSKRDLQAKFAHLLKKRHGGKRGRKISNPTTASTAKYPLYRTVSIQTLRIQIEVYDMVMAKRRGELDMTLAEIGEKMRLVKTAMPKGGDHPHDAEYKRNVLSSTVSRHFKDAQRIISNTAIGQFPNSR